MWCLDPQLSPGKLSVYQERIIYIWACVLATIGSIILYTSLNRSCSRLLLLEHVNILRVTTLIQCSLSTKRRVVGFGRIGMCQWVLDTACGNLVYLLVVALCFLSRFRAVDSHFS